MVPMPFEKLIKQCLTEYKTKKSLFDVKAIAKQIKRKIWNFVEED